MPVVEVPQSAQGVALPLGRRVPAGRERWYFVSVPDGSEDRMCELLRERIGSDVLLDAFVPSFERNRKFQGEWRACRMSMYPGHIVASAADARALARALEPFRGRAQLVRTSAGRVTPASRDLQRFLTSVWDERRVVPFSFAEVVGGELRVLSGPLVGMEDRVLWYRRRDCMARVDVSEGREPCVIRLGLNIPTVRDG